MIADSFVTDLKAHVREGVASTIEYLATPPVLNPPDRLGEFSKWRAMTSRPNWKTANVVLAFAVLSSSLLLAATQPADGQQPKPDAAEANIGNWIKGLGSADFQQREQATQSLTEAGAAAIGELIVAGFSDDAEVRFRVASILQRMSVSSNTTAANKARLALRIIREAPDPATARRMFGPLVTKGEVVDLQRFIGRNSSGRVTLNLRQTKVTADHFRQLSSPSFKGLEAIEASGTNLDDGALVHLKKLPLSELGLHSTKVTDAGLAHLKAMPLKTLSLGFTQVTDTGLAKLKGLPLESLMLAKTRVTDEGLAHLSDLPLKSLNLVWVDNVTDAGLARLSKLRLERFSITSRQITDDGLKHLRGMPLRSLSLGGTQVTDAGIAHLVDMPLQLMWLYGTNVTDASLAHLQKIKTLKVLYIQDTQFSEEAAEELRKTVQTVHTGRAKRTAAKPVDRERITMVVRVSHADIKRAEAEEFKDAFAVTNRAITDLIRAQARPKCIELGYDPNNIGLPRYSDEVAKFKKDERGYSGQITFDLYGKR